MNDNRTTSSIVPDPLAPHSEKLTTAYGLKAAKVMAQEWFNGGLIGTGTQFYDRSRWVNKMRLHNRGEQDTTEYKQFVARQKKDLSFLNLDFRPINILEKFTNIVSNGISDDFYNVDIQSIDRTSILQKRNKVLEHKANMYAKKMMEQAKQLTGMDLGPKGFVPEDNEELELWSEIKERPKQEAAEEINIKFVKKTSNWRLTKKQADKDAVLVGLQVARHYTDPNNGPQVAYVDPEYFGHSYVERNDFSDAYYFFYVETITINDIKRESGLDDKTLREIAKRYGNTKSNSTDFNRDYNTCPIDLLLDYKIDVMRYSLKSAKEIVYKKYLDKKNNTKKVAKRDSNYQVPEGAEKSRLSKVLDTWFEGNYIIGSEVVYGWKESENLAKDEMNKVIPPFIAQATNIYKNKLQSFQSNIIPHDNQMQYVHLKIQHLYAELKPDIIVLNEDHLADLEPDTKGAQKTSAWEMALTILNVKGVVIEKRADMGELGVKDGLAARPMPTQQGTALAALLNVWAHYYNLIRETTGVNPARDGTASQDSLVGLNQMMQLASNTATKHIVDASVEFERRVCEAISARVKGIFKFDKSGKLKKLFEQAVGKENISAMESLKDRHLHEFGFSIEMVPAKEELEELKQDLAIALQEGTIDVSEKYEILRVAKGNIKRASQYMRFVRKRRINEKMKENQANMKMQTEMNIQSSQAKSKGDIEVYQGKKQIDLMFEQQKSLIDLQKKEAELQLTQPYEQIKFEQDVYIEQMKNMQSFGLTKYKEDEKAKREKENSSRQSKMIEQRQKDLPAFNFDDAIDVSQLFQ